MNHLAEAKKLLGCAVQRDEDYFSVQLAAAHALIALVEQLQSAANFGEQVRLGGDHPLYKDE